MKKIYALALLSLLLVPLGLRAQTGTKGNTITIDGTNCTVLYSNLQSASAAGSWFSYLRHNQAPIQIINANPENAGNLSTMTVPALQGFPGTQTPNGTGMFASSSFANNISFANNSTKDLEFYNNVTTGKYYGLCFAIIAPKGYRFTEYYMDICSNKHGNSAISNNIGAKGATISRFTYTGTNTTAYNLIADETQTLSSSGSNSEIYAHTLSNAGNILYFRVVFTGTSSQSCLHLNQLRLTYVIDEEFEATIPHDYEGNKVNTGILNLGEFKEISQTIHCFERADVTAYEDVHIVAENGATEMSIENGKINVPAGTYWIESPAKFRITGAKLNFQLAAGHTETTWKPTP